MTRRSWHDPAAIAVVLAMAAGAPIAAAGGRFQVGPEFTVADTDIAGRSPAPATALAVRDDGRFVVAWLPRPPGSPGPLLFRVFDPDGTPITDAALATDSAQGDVRIAFTAADRFTIAWAHEFRLLTRTFTADGAPLAGPFEIDFAGLVPVPRDLAPAQGGGSILLHNVSYGRRMGSVRSIRLDEAGAPAGPSHIVVQNLIPSLNIPSEAALARGPAGPLATWVSETWDYDDRIGYSVQARAIEPDGHPTGLAHRVTQQGDFPDVTALPDGDFLVAWHPWAEDQPSKFHGTRVDAAGSPVAGDVLLTGIDGNRSPASLASNASEAVFAWHEWATVKLRHLGPDGVPLPGELVLSDPNWYSTDAVQLGLTPAGHAVAVWAAQPYGGTWQLVGRVTDIRGALVGELDPWIYLGSDVHISGHGFTAGSVIQVWASEPGGVVTSHGPYTPTSWSPTELVWSVPTDIALGHGFMSLVVINTDQDFVSSNTSCHLLLGTRLGTNPPALEKIGGYSLAGPTCDVPLAWTWGFIEPGEIFEVVGESLDRPVANLFTAAGNLGPLVAEPGGTGNLARFRLPANTPVGPATLQLVNAPYAGDAHSNAVVFTVGPRADVFSVTQDGTTLTVTGEGFSTNAVINLFNRQGNTAVNLGGLDGAGEPVLPLTNVTPTSFQFQRPAAAEPGPSYVQVLNPRSSPDLCVKAPRGESGSRARDLLLDSR